MYEFKKEELEKRGYYPHFGTDCGYPQADIPIYNHPITPKENALRFIKREDFAWIPSLSSGDINNICPSIYGDLMAIGPDGGIDSFGIEWVAVNPEYQEPAWHPSGNPLLEELEGWENVVMFPDLDSWDWEGCAREYEGLSPDRLRMGSINMLFFERLITLMDFEGAAMALLAEPEACAALFAKLADHAIGMLERYKKYFDIDVVFMYDDWGTERAPMFSADVLKELFMPNYKRILEKAHELDIFCISHSDGHLTSFVPYFIEMGFDMWNLQLRANSDIMDVIQAYGDQIMFDIYTTIESESNEEFEQKATAFYKTLGQTHAVSLSVMDETGGLSDEHRDIVYRLARLAANNQL